MGKCQLTAKRLNTYPTVCLITMAKQVTNLAVVEHPFNQPVGPDKLLAVTLCDDGSVYEFESFEDEPNFTLRARGSTDDDARDFSQSRAQLPQDVKNVFDDMDTTIRK
jgi:hypothetical protein